MSPLDRPVRWAALLFVLVAGLYLSFPAARYNYDGVACAIAVELGDLKHLVHGNHLAYGFLGWLFFEFWKILGYSGPALLSLQALSSLLGAAGVGAFFLMMRRSGFDRRFSACVAACLAVSDVYWRWSLEAQVYPLGAFFAFCAAVELLRPSQRPIIIGLLQAGAVLGHVGHLMLAPAAIWLLKDTCARRRYLLALGSTVGAAYLAAGAFIMRPGSWEELRVWLLGSAALTVDRQFDWHGGYSMPNLLTWLTRSLQLFGAGVWAGALGWCLAAWGAIKGGLGSKPVRLAVAWLAGYALLYLSWESGTVVYRYSDLAPLWLLIALGLSGLPFDRAPLLACLAAAALGLWNWARVIRPGADPALNADLQYSLWVGRETSEDTWILAEGVDRVYVPYFAHRKTLSLRYHDRASLAKRIDALRRSGEPVAVVPERLPPDWRPFSLPLRMAPRAVAEGRTLYLVE